MYKAYRGLLHWLSSLCNSPITFFRGLFKISHLHLCKWIPIRYNISNNLTM